MAIPIYTTRLVVRFVHCAKKLALWTNGSKLEKVEMQKIQAVMPVEAWLSIKNKKKSYMSFMTSLLLSNVIDADHQNCHLFTKQRAGVNLTDLLMQF